MFVISCVWPLRPHGILPTQGSNLCLLCLLHWQADSLPLHHLGSPNCIKNLYVLHLSGCRMYWWRRQWHSTPVLLPGKSHGRRSLVGCSPWGREESDMTESTGEGNGNPLQCSCLENPTQHRGKGSLILPVGCWCLVAKNLPDNPSAYASLAFTEVSLL